MPIFKFFLCISGACGRKDFKQGCDKIRAMFWEENTVNCVKRWFREKTKYKDTHDFQICPTESIKLNLLTQGRGQADSCGTHFIFLIEAIEGVAVIQRETGARRKDYNGTLERLGEG